MKQLKLVYCLQIAQALDQGATGILLIVAVVGGDLETLLDACTIMGTEAVSYHHPYTILQNKISLLYKYPKINPFTPLFNSCFN
jgi:indole-3-glycerol phosphate synthase